ncbi:hypothetical protein NQZ68_001886 [Dissostichus eleginoides]|nr:hypothetical protein NQZ68_001886 [Dissostichus eleginoides]
MAGRPTKNIFKLKSVGLSAERNATGRLTKVWSSLGGARVTMEHSAPVAATLPRAPSHPYTGVCHCTHECKHTRDPALSARPYIPSGCQERRAGEEPVERLGCR